MKFRLLLLGLLVQVSGCALLPQQPPPPEPQQQQADVPVEVPPGEEPEPVPVAPAEEPEPVPAPPPAPPPEPELPLVAVMLSSRAPDYERVALALESVLQRTETYDLSDRSLSPRDAFDAIEASGAGAIVAVGLRAAVYANNYGRLPVVFSQVFNVEDNGLVGENIRGVAVIPPLAKHLAAWLSRAPQITSIGAIVGDGHDALMAEASEAAVAAGLQFHYRVANSDRQTLYQFNRLLPEIDAFWLFPDNRVLSAAVLAEIMDGATRHRVEVAVFNDNLLRLGATMSAGSDENDIARVVLSILRRVEAGEIDSIPATSPLNAIKLPADDAVAKPVLAAPQAALGDVAP